MSSQDSLIIGHKRACLLSSHLAKFKQFYSQLLHLRAVCVTACLVWARNVLLFFRLKFSNSFSVKLVFGRSLNFCTFLYWCGFEFAPASGSSDSVTDLVMTSQDYIKVGHVRIWLLSSCPANFQQFQSECFLQFLLFLISSCLQGPSLIVAFKGRVFFGFVWRRLEVYCVCRLQFSNGFPIETHVFGKS